MHKLCAVVVLLMIQRDPNQRHSKSSNLARNVGPSVSVYSSRVSRINVRSGAVPEMASCRIEPQDIVSRRIKLRDPRLFRVIGKLRLGGINFLAYIDHGLVNIDGRRKLQHQSNGALDSEGLRIDQPFEADELSLQWAP